MMRPSWPVIGTLVTMDQRFCPSKERDSSLFTNGTPPSTRSESGELLRFATAGSVDDGNSTLIGRLLYDTKQIFQDQLDQVAAESIRRHGSETGCGRGRDKAGEGRQRAA